MRNSSNSGHLENFAQHADAVKVRLEDIGHKLGSLRYPMVVIEDDYFLELADKLTGGSVRHASIDNMIMPTSDDIIAFSHANILFCVSDVAACVPENPEEDPEYKACLDAIGGIKNKPRMMQAHFKKQVMAAYMESCCKKAYQDGQRQRIADDLKRSFMARIELLELERDLLLDAMEAGVIDKQAIKTKLDDRRCSICMNYQNANSAAHPGFEVKTFIVPREDIRSEITESDILQAALHSDLLVNAGLPDFEETNSLHEDMLLLEIVRRAEGRW